MKLATGKRKRMLTKTQNTNPDRSTTNISTVVPSAFTVKHTQQGTVPGRTAQPALIEKRPLQVHITSAIYTRIDKQPSNIRQSPYLTHKQTSDSKYYLC